MDIIRQLFPIVLPTGGSLDTPLDKANFAVGLLQTVLVLLFIGVIIVGIVFAALAGYKFIASRGEEKEVTSAQSGIKQVLIGLFVAFIGAIAVFVISSTFSSSSGSTVNKSLLCVFGDYASCSSTIVTK